MNTRSIRKNNITRTAIYAATGVLGVDLSLMNRVTNSVIHKIATSI